MIRTRRSGQVGTGNRAAIARLRVSRGTVLAVRAIALNLRRETRFDILYSQEQAEFPGDTGDPAAGQH
ncbi:MAG: hypothetical protein ABI310_10250 [Microbacteriaceae bacterium]